MNVVVFFFTNRISDLPLCNHLVSLFFKCFILRMPVRPLRNAYGILVRTDVGRAEYLFLKYFRMYVGKLYLMRV